MLVKLTVFALPRLTRVVAWRMNVLMTLPATERKRVICKYHTDFKYVSNNSIQDKLIILHVKQINLVVV